VLFQCLFFLALPNNAMRYCLQKAHMLAKWHKFRIAFAQALVFWNREINFMV